jgi:ABC-type multidrug transport system fused ATPase/permease subunit
VAPFFILVRIFYKIKSLLTIEKQIPPCLYVMQVRYAPHLPFVLKGLTCTLPGGKKTGIVGRTGGGKSTLVQALFRIVDPCIGQVLIDGIDICTIGLHDLRTRLSIIPQDPVMFQGTLRSNVDPLQEYSDEQIWEVNLMIFVRIIHIHYI